MEEILRLPKLLGPGCVLQREAAVRVWGWCGILEIVQVEICQKVWETFSDAQGRFALMLENLPVGGPYTMKVSCGSGTTAQEILVDPVFVGDVMVCGGQSNMELPMRRVREKFPKEFSEGGDSQVHLYKVTERVEFTEVLGDHVQAGWTACTAENLDEISAVSYFLGKYMHRERGIPVGIINLSLGGTPAEAWISREGLAPFKSLLEIRKEYQNAELRKTITGAWQRAEDSWQKEIERQEPCTKDAPWQTFLVPGFLEEAGFPDFCGSIWLKKRFEVSGNIAGRQGLLRFGTMTDSDHIYLNGELIGETGYCYPPRRYPIPEGLLKRGENEILIRLVCRSGKGRITPGKPYEILAGDEVIPLSGEWLCQIRAVCHRAPEQVFMNRNPSVLFQGMVAPCLPYTVKGVAWYQGESNDDRPFDYAVLLKTLIKDWREHWMQKRLPFIVVQLPDCGIDIAGDNAWAQIRKAQAESAELPDVAVTVNLELGEDNDLHPLDKKSIAYRIWLAVRGMIEGEDIVYSGPRPLKCTRLGKRVRLIFDTMDGKDLASQDGQAPGEFEVAGQDGIYYPAGAILYGREVKLICIQVEHPISVRYAWSDTPRRGLLCSRSGLLVSPFEMICEAES